LFVARHARDLACPLSSSDGRRRGLRTRPAPNPDLEYAKPIDVIADGDYLRVVAAILSMAEGVTA